MLTLPSEIIRFQEVFKDKLLEQRTIFVDQLIKREGTDVLRDELRGKIIMIDDALNILDAVIVECYSDRRSLCN